MMRNGLGEHRSHVQHPLSHQAILLRAVEVMGLRSVRPRTPPTPYIPECRWDDQDLSVRHARHHRGEKVDARNRTRPPDSPISRKMLASPMGLTKYYPPRWEGHPTPAVVNGRARKLEPNHTRVWIPRHPSANPTPYGRETAKTTDKNY